MSSQPSGAVGSARRSALLGANQSDDDWYRVALADGESMSVTLDSLLGGVSSVELYDATNTRLAFDAGPAAHIREFLDTTSDGLPALYFVRVFGFADEYNLVVTRGARLAIGDAADVSATFTDGIAIGRGATGDGTEAVSIGRNSSVFATRGIAIGYLADVSATFVNGIAIGRSAKGDGTMAVAIGYSATVYANDGIAIGNQADVSATFTDAIAIGRVSKGDGIDAAQFTVR